MNAARGKIGEAWQQHQQKKQKTEDEVFVISIQLGKKCHQDHGKKNRNKKMRIRETYRRKIRMCEGQVDREEKIRDAKKNTAWH